MENSGLALPQKTLSFWKKFLITLDMIKFQHSIFALPFALVSLFYATNGSPNIGQFTLIVLAMVTARNAAMSFNRIVDLGIDAKNPRTQHRPLVVGTVSLSHGIIFCILNITLFLVIAAQFNTMTLWLSPMALFIVLGYSLTKHFTHYTQFFLGLALGISPLATWIAVRGGLELFPVLIALGVLFWVAGFDLIYACQDYEFDKKHGLKNLVVVLGIRNALFLAKILHGLCLGFLSFAGLIFTAGMWYFAGIGVMGIFLIYEHRLVKAKDLSHVDVAFFTMNGYVGLSYFFFALMDLFL